MKLIRDWAALPDDARSGAVAIGNFEGVHRGHARIVEHLVAQARRVGGPAVVFTFDPHPVRLLRPALAPASLSWTERKAQLLVELGADFVIAYPTDAALLELSPRQFFERIVRDKLDARALVEGTNFYFGHGRAGTIDVLRSLAVEASIQLEVVPPVVLDGEVVSSSGLRNLISAGAVDQASRLLTRPYRIRGTVVRGVGRGAPLGFPTANLEHIDTLLPALGVYAGWADLGTSRWKAAIHIGPNPTFAEAAPKVEVHLIDAEAQLYGQTLEVEFLGRLRDVVRFPSVEALRAQIARDVATAREIGASATA